MPALGDLAINLAASVVAGAVVLLWQVLRQRRKAHRRRRFFGLATVPTCVVYVPKHASAESELSVHRRDAAAMVEVAAAARECGAEIELTRHGEDESGRRLGDGAEFTIGGPAANPRTQAHLETFLPGLTMDDHEDNPDGLTIRADGKAFDRIQGKEEYVALAKALTDKGSPVFVLCGQTAISNHAAARYLTRGHRELASKHGVAGRFCLVLKVVNSWAFGERKVELVADVTRAAFTPPRPDTTS